MIRRRIARTSSTASGRSAACQISGCSAASHACAEREVAGRRPGLEQRLELPGAGPRGSRPGGWRACAPAARGCPRAAARVDRPGHLPADLRSAGRRSPGRRRRSSSPAPTKMTSTSDDVVELAAAALAHRDDGRAAGVGARARPRAERRSAAGQGRVGQRGTARPSSARRRPAGQVGRRDAQQRQPVRRRAAAGARPSTGSSANGPALVVDRRCVSTRHRAGLATRWSPSADDAPSTATSRRAQPRRRRAGRRPGRRPAPSPARRAASSMPVQLAQRQVGVGRRRPARPARSAAAASTGSCASASHRPEPVRARADAAARPRRRRSKPYRASRPAGRWWPAHRGQPPSSGSSRPARAPAPAGPARRGPARRTGRRTAATPPPRRP